MGATQSSADTPGSKSSTSSVREFGSKNGSSSESVDGLGEENTHGANDAGASTATTIKFHDPDRPKGGMPLVNYVCRKKKKAYDKCVATWYSKEFMTGAGSLNQEEICGDKFDAYKRCVLKGIRIEVWEKQGLPPPAPGSPMADAVDDEED